MAGRKTTKTAVKAAEATEVEAIVPGTEEIKAEEKTAEPKAAEEKAAARKKAPAKESTAKKAPAKKADLKSNVHVQYGGRSYSEEDLIKIAKDVWKYDLKRKVGELTEVELYVKPEENKVYYVMNRDFTGSFDI